MPVKNITTLAGSGTWAVKIVEPENWMLAFWFVSLPFTWSSVIRFVNAYGVTYGEMPTDPGVFELSLFVPVGRRPGIVILC